MARPPFESWSQSKLVGYQDILLVMRQKQAFPPDAWQCQWLDDRISAIDKVLDARVQQLWSELVGVIEKSIDTEAGLEAAIQAAMKRHPAGSALPPKDTP
jgi:hypothetical protein